MASTRCALGELWRGEERADIFGARTFAMRIWLKPDKMAALNISPRGPLIYPTEVWMDADSDGVAAVKREVAGRTVTGVVLLVWLSAALSGLFTIVPTAILHAILR